MANKQQIYRDGDRYVALTGKCPKGFKDVLFVAFTGLDPSSITEGVMGKEELAQMESVDEVPEDWADAFEAVGIKRQKQKKVSPPPPPKQDEFALYVELEPEPVVPARKRVRKDANLLQGLCVLVFILFTYIWYSI